MEDISETQTTKHPHKSAKEYISLLQQEEMLSSIKKALQRFLGEDRTNISPPTRLFILRNFSTTLEQIVKSDLSIAKKMLKFSKDPQLKSLLQIAILKTERGQKTL